MNKSKKESERDKKAREENDILEKRRAKSIKNRYEKYKEGKYIMEKAVMYKSES